MYSARPVDPGDMFAGKIFYIEWTRKMDLLWYLRRAIEHNGGKIALDPLSPSVTHVISTFHRTAQDIRVTAWQKTIARNRQEWVGVQLIWHLGTVVHAGTGELVHPATKVVVHYSWITACLEAGERVPLKGWTVRCTLAPCSPEPRSIDTRSSAAEGPSRLAETVGCHGARPGCAHSQARKPLCAVFPLAPTTQRPPVSTALSRLDTSSSEVRPVSLNSDKRDNVASFRIRHHTDAVRTNSFDPRLAVSQTSPPRPLPLAGQIFLPGDPRAALYGIEVRQPVSETDESASRPPLTDTLRHEVIDLTVDSDDEAATDQHRGHSNLGEDLELGDSCIMVAEPRTNATTDSGTTATRGGHHISPSGRPPSRPSPAAAKLARPTPRPGQPYVRKQYGRVLPEDRAAFDQLKGEFETWLAQGGGPSRGAFLRSLPISEQVPYTWRTLFERYQRVYLRDVPGWLAYCIPRTKSKGGLGAR